MPDVDQKQLTFSSIDSKTVEASFDGGAISSDAGVLLLREVDLQIGLTEKLTNAIYDTRDQRYVKQEFQTLMAQRIYQIACGYEDADDATTLRKDPAFKIAVGRNPQTDRDLGSQPTFSRFENQPTRKDLYRFAKALVDLFIASYDEPPSIIVIDLDTTDDTTYGGQQLALFNGYFEEKCFLPLHIFEGLSGKLITSILRPGKKLSGREILIILKRLIPYLRQAWGNETVIVVRGDSEFAAPEVEDYIEDNNGYYVFGQKANSVISELGEPVMERARELYSYWQRKVRCFGEFFYQAGTWRAPRRIVMKAEITKRGENPRYVVTNMTDPIPQVVYDDIYCARGNSENYIKNHKVYLHSDRTSCHSFLANQFRLLLHSAAYVLLHTLQKNLFRGTEWASAQYNNLQLRVLKMGAVIRELKTKIVIHLPSAYPLKELYHKACGILAQLRAPPQYCLSG